MTKKQKKWSSHFVTLTHGTFFNKRSKNSHRIYYALNKMSNVQTSLTNVNPFPQIGVALGEGLTDCSCLCCALLTIT